jgi:hypothetical protein
MQDEQTDERHWPYRSTARGLPIADRTVPTRLKADNDVKTTGR